ncbi:hypothetical protein COCNU_scaffold004025G000030 [Cocos nucifera]|nr:hypothetical protein [Cocos nucifera]
MSQLAGRCCTILGGGPSVNGPRRAEIHPQSRRQLSRFRSPRLWRAMASREPFKGSEMQKTKPSIPQTHTLFWST